MKRECKKYLRKFKGNGYCDAGCMRYLLYHVFGANRYSFDYASVHFIMMSTEHNFTQGSPQYEWMEQDLKNVNRSLTPWVIMAGHRAMYTSQMIESKDLLERAPSSYLLSCLLEQWVLFGAWCLIKTAYLQMLDNLFSVLLLLLLYSEFCQGPVHYKPTLIKNTSFSGSQLNRLLEVMDARKNRACEEDSRISVGRPFFFRILRSSTCSGGYFSCNRLRVRTGHGKPGRSLKVFFW